MAYRTRLTQKKKIEFIEHLRKTANVTRSAEIINISRTRVYEIKKEDAQFSADWEEAIEKAIDNLEAEARRRAFEGVEEPIYYRGKKIDTVRKYSDVLLIFMLKSHRPEKYRERSSIDVTNNTPPSLVINIEGGPGIKTLDSPMMEIDNLEPVSGTPTNGKINGSTNGKAS